MTSHAGSRAEASAETKQRGAFLRDRLPKLTWAEWKDTLLAVKREFVADQLTVVAGNVAFSGVIAFFPVLISIISIYGLVSDPNDLTHQLRQLSATVPPSARALLFDQMREIIGSSGKKLGFGLLVSLVAALLAGSGGLHALIDGINLAYDQKETRSYFRVRLLALALTVAVVGFIVIAVAAIAILPHALVPLALAEVSQTLLTLGRWPALALTVMVGLSLLYRYAPNGARPRWRWLSLGAVMATLVWLIASFGFAAYSSNFANYNKTYGTLAGMVVFMLWVYISTLAILFGAELNAELERRAQRKNGAIPEVRVGS